MRGVTFASCGLAAENNFLQAPVCRCGCGEYASLVFDTTDELYDFIGAMLSEYECNYCAIFVIHKDNSVVMAIKLENGTKIYGAQEDNGDVYGLIAGMQKEFQFHCYGLLEQVDTNLYRIVMD